MTKIETEADIIPDFL